jgi:hypothetical protein
MMEGLADAMYIFFAEAVAGVSSEYRPGARHALILYVTAVSADAAREKAMEEVSRAGWMHARVIQGGAVAREIQTDRLPVLQQALEGARRSGAAMVVYNEEIRHDA